MIFNLTKSYILYLFNTRPYLYFVLCGFFFKIVRLYNQRKLKIVIGFSARHVRVIDNFYIFSWSKRMEMF